MPETVDERRSGGQTVFMRIVLDRPPDDRALWSVAGAVRGSDEVMSPGDTTINSPGFEIEVILRATSSGAVCEYVLPRVQALLSERTIRLIQIDGEDVLIHED